jgi:hypothetical protein
VRSALRCKRDYFDFYHKWNEEYLEMESEIDNACRKLPNLSQCTLDPKVTTPKYIREICYEKWFKNRVFDTLLWHTGSKGRK